MTKPFDEHLDEAQRDLMRGLTSPSKIQAFLDEIPYSDEDANRCPLSVLKDRKAHCLDGGLFAAAALRRLGYPPILVDMFPDPGMDDDHILAIYHQDGRLGAVAKSNFSGLRFREAVYRSLRELVMSYFEHFYNVNGIKTLRSYTVPFHLKNYDTLDWMTSDENLDKIEHRLAQIRRFMLLPPGMAAKLTPVDERSFQAGMLGVNQAGLYRPKG